MAFAQFMGSMPDLVLVNVGEGGCCSVGFKGFMLAPFYSRLGSEPTPFHLILCLMALGSFIGCWLFDNAKIFSEQTCS
jgi:hypothetical protein